MASNLMTDDELRSRLSSILGSSKNIPPIVDATRPLLMEKLSRLQCHGELETISDDAKCLSVPKAVCLLFIPLNMFVQMLTNFGTAFTDITYTQYAT